KQAILARADSAIAAMQGFADWLKALKHDQPRPFRLGKELYDKKFAYEIQSRYTPEQIFEKAVANKEKLHTEMAKLSRQLWKKYLGDAAMPADSLQMIRMVIDNISLKHVQPDSFQAAIEQQIPVLQQFVQEK